MYSTSLPFSCTHLYLYWLTLRWYTPKQNAFLFRCLSCLYVHKPNPIHGWVVLLLSSVYLYVSVVSDFLLLKDFFQQPNMNDSGCWSSRARLNKLEPLKTQRSHDSCQAWWKWTDYQCYLHHICRPISVYPLVSRLVGRDIYREHLVWDVQIVWELKLSAEKRWHSLACSEHHVFSDSSSTNTWTVVHKKMFHVAVGCCVFDVRMLLLTRLWTVLFILDISTLGGKFAALAWLACSVLQ